MDVQIAVISPLLVMDFANAFSVVRGSIDKQQRTAPEVKSTKRVSQRLASATTVRMTTRIPIQPRSVIYKISYCTRALSLDVTKRRPIRMKIKPMPDV